MRVVQLGFECNNACVFCAQGALARLAPPVTDTAVEAALAGVRAGEPLAFVGGEPTLHPELDRWIAAARRRGASQVLLQTNGRLLAVPGRAAALAAAGLTALDLSLHGDTAPVHDHHTGVPGSFEQSCAGARAGRSAGLALGVTAVVTKSNLRHLSGVVRLAHRLGADAIRLAPAQAHGRAFAAAPRVLPAPQLARPHVAAALRVAAELGLAGLLGDRVTPGLEQRFAGLGVAEPAPGGRALASRATAPPLAL
ncbi:MAG: radical SAM protein [Polyangiaceae bacterium]|nr:radical SAM protein [Polyangiaceae bacterium]